MIDKLINVAFLLYFALCLVFLVESKQTQNQCYMIEYTITSLVFNTIIFSIKQYIKKSKRLFVVSMVGLSITSWGFLELLNTNCVNTNDNIVSFNIGMCLFQAILYSYMLSYALCALAIDGGDLYEDI